MNSTPTLTHLLVDLAPFSRHFIRLPLYLYQLRPLQAILDDRLLSAALVAVFDDLYITGHLRLGSAHSAIIPAEDPLDNLSF